MSLAEAKRHFDEFGFVVVEDVFDIAQDFQPIIEDYNQTLDTLANQWYAEGKLKSTYAGLPFDQRFVQVMIDSGQGMNQYFDISLPQKNIRDDTPIHLSESVFRLLRHPRLLDVAAAFIGDEIYSNPIQHVRIKMPEHLLSQHQIDGLSVSTPWHQDQGVAMPEADESQILTVWLPITDATVENGCLVVIPGSHRGELAIHCPGRNKAMGLEIPPELRAAGAIPVPVKAGSALLMHHLTMHASLSNTSDDIRWSFDLRFQPIGQPTGRPEFPGFVARSQILDVLDDFALWRQQWLDTRSRLARETATVFNRWDGSQTVCA